MKAPRLADCDLSASLTKAAYRKRTEDNQVHLVKLMSRIIEKGLRVVVCLEGWDAAGKGGAIRRLVKNLDARHCQVYAIAKPTQEELDRHYLWRFWRRAPAKGSVAVFDRSWYGRVLVERVEGFCSTADWQRAYQEINEFERHLIDDGHILVKVFLHIDAETQKKRFHKREKDPLKRWKMNPEDYRNAKKRGRYATAIDDMFARTHTAIAPWQIVAGNDKRLARISVQDAFIAAVEQYLAGPRKPKRRPGTVRLTRKR